MKRILVVFCVLTFHSFFKGQISMQTNLPPALPVNSDITFDVKINKGNSSHFAKYQMEFPRGTVIKEVESKSGSFTSEENTVKIIWVMAPLEPEFTISLKLNTGVVAGKKLFGQKYFYVENEDKKEVEMEPFVVHIKDSTGSGSAVSTSEFVTLIPKPLPSLLTTTINAAEISTKNPELLKQQVLQLRKDSRDAYNVGEREKNKAQLKITQANEDIAKAEAMTDENEKKTALETATKNKAKAENDLEVASRVLVLAKSLDDNATEIDAINRSVNPGSYSTQYTSKNPVSSSPSTPPVVSTPEAVTLNTDEEPSKKGSDSKNNSSESESGLVYKIQLGAFSKEPSRRDFKAIGKVKIIEENGMYKVLYGSFSSKDEAFKGREQVIAKGFDGFVVSYQDGVRVK